MRNEHVSEMRYSDRYTRHIRENFPLHMVEDHPSNPHLVVDVCVRLSDADVMTANAYGVRLRKGYRARLFEESLTITLEEVLRCEAKSLQRA